MNIRNNFCLYFHINPLKNQIFYVGIGSINRAQDFSRRNIFWKRTVKKYGGVIVNIVENNLTWDEACKLEKFYINKIGRYNLKLGTLVNLTDGGDGSFGTIISEETRNRMSKSHKGFRNYKHSEKTKIKMRKPRVNKENFKKEPMSQESKDKISKANTGKTAWNKDLIGYLKDKKLSQEHKDKISKGNKGKSRNKGRKLSIETRKKVSISKDKYKKPILQYDLNNNFIKEWESATEIKNTLNYSNLSKCCRDNLEINKKCTRYGYIWKWKNTQPHL